MNSKKIDTITKIAMRSRGITVKEKRVRFQGVTVLFRYNEGRYDVFSDNEKVDSIETNNINQAIAEYKKKKQS